MLCFIVVLLLLIDRLADSIRCKTCQHWVRVELQQAHGRSFIYTATTSLLGQESRAFRTRNTHPNTINRCRANRINQFWCRMSSLRPRGSNQMTLVGIVSCNWTNIISLGLGVLRSYRKKSIATCLNQTPTDLAIEQACLSSTEQLHQPGEPL